MRFVLALAFTFSISASLLFPASIQAQSRWSQTATNGGGLQLGDPTTITWSFLPDGSTIVPAFGGESNAPSSLVNFLDTNLGAGAGGSDLTNRPWFTHFESFFDRWGEISGLSFVYEPNDDGQAISSSVNPRGQLGVRGDVRIGGHSIDGQSGSNTLAYNYFPDNGDMVIDTDNVNFYSNPSHNYLRLRNVLAHEFGHGMGLSHFESNNSNQLMEPFISTAYDGPQIDDIHQAQRRYGDALEKNGGNDTSANATDLGTIGTSGAIVGSDANQGASVQEVTPDQSDFVTIDDNGDVDFFEFTISADSNVIIILEMVGPSYNRGPQGGTQSAYDLSQLSDLDLALVDSNGTTILMQSNTTGLGVQESINMDLDAGTYFIRVTGRDNDAQFYQLSVTSSIPEPGTMLLLGATFLVGAVRLRRRRNSA